MIFKGVSGFQEVVSGVLRRYQGSLEAVRVLQHYNVFPGLLRRFQGLCVPGNASGDSKEPDKEEFRGSLKGLPGADENIQGSRRHL